MTATPKKASISLPFLCIGAAALSAACAAADAKPKDPAPEAALAVPLVRVAASEVPRYLVVTGTLRGRREAKVAADASGKVIATHAERGDVVAAGKPLVVLDATHAALGRAEAAAMAETARAEEAQAQADCDRADRLFAARAISEAEHQKLQTACTTRLWSTKAAFAREGIAKKSLGDTRVRAPFTGVVSERYVERGEYVRPGESVVTLVELDPLRLELSVSESSVGLLKAGQRVEFDVPAYPDERFEGTIDHLGASLSLPARSLVVEARVENPDHRLRPGMFATARLVVGSDARPMAPAGSFVGTERSRRAFVVKNRRLEERVVLVGEPVGDRIAILAGIQTGELIVERPTAQTRDGVLVQ